LARERERQEKIEEHEKQIQEANRKIYHGRKQFLTVQTSVWKDADRQRNLEQLVTQKFRDMLTIEEWAAIVIQTRFRTHVQNRIAKLSAAQNILKVCIPQHRQTICIIRLLIPSYLGSTSFLKHV